jgi:MYXO-CTERM domain-containing protein
MDSTATQPATSNDERVSKHLRTLAEEAEALIGSSAHAGSEKLDAARERLQGELLHLRTRLAALEAAAGARVKQVAHQTDEVVHSHPYAAIGAAAAAGLLLGFFLRRR